MLDILEIRDHAIKAATDGRPYTECPYGYTSVHGQLWLDFYNAECHWLEFCKRESQTAQAQTL